MDHAQMQSLIGALVRKVKKSSGAGDDAAIHAIVNGLQEYVGEYESDLIEALDDAPGGLDAGADEIRLWRHMYSVLDRAGLKLRQVPRPAKKRGAPKGKPAALADVRKHAKAAREAMRRAMRGT